ncbi:MAG: rRNA maturation RNase YbeY [Alphaproteobacteria bacterium]|nr:rRNA maturation RNase YbeY [Alphaproteobacteria bacterium]MBQ8660376.1 rRNA maturation RNase YbeY [Alphaproteobacteria bacterium]
MFFFRPKVKLSFIVKSKKWNNKISNIEKLSNKVVATTFKKIKHPIKKGMEVNIMLTNDKEIQTLNKEYRGKNKPTNVLSFETGDEILLGDIVMSIDTLLKEAKEQKISVADHYAHLLCHGMLHLLGFDHIEEDEANEMEFFEIEILKEFKIANPYE